MRTKHTLSTILLATVLTISLAQAESPRSKIQQSYGQGIERIDLIADQAEYNWGSGADANWATFRGNVVIRCNGNELHAEEIRFNSKTHDAEAKGRVVLLGANGEMWTGNEITVDMTNPEFPSVQASDMLIYYAPYRLEVGKGGVRQGSYYAEDVIFTTCTTPPATATTSSTPATPLSSPTTISPPTAPFPTSSESPSSTGPTSGRTSTTTTASVSNPDTAPAGASTC